MTVSGFFGGSSPGDDLSFRSDLESLQTAFFTGEEIDLSDQIIDEKINRIVENLKDLSRDDLLDLEDSVKLKIFQRAINRNGFSEKVKKLLTDNIFAFLLEKNKEAPFIEYALHFEDGVLKLCHGAYLPQEAIFFLLSAFNSKEQVKKLDLSDCEKLQDLQFLRDFKNLEFLDLTGCTELRSLDGIKYAQNTLKHLKLFKCFNLKNLNQLETCRYLSSLNAGRCGRLENIGKITEKTGLAAHPALKKLILTRCNSLLLFNLETIKGLVGLQTLKLAHLPFISDISWLNKFQSLEELDLSYTGITDASSLNHLPSLSISLEGCAKLVAYPAWYHPV